MHSELNTPENVNVSEDINNKIDGYEPLDDDVSEHESALSERESEEESSVPVVVKDKEKEASVSARPSHRTAQASRAQTQYLKAKGLV